MQNNKIKIVILAGGIGKRMQSDLPKVLAPLRGSHMIGHVLDSVGKISNEKPLVIIGHKGDLIKKELGETCCYALQPEALGTGHAVSCAKEDCLDAENIVVLSGDQPFITGETIKNLIDKHLESNAKITFTTTIVGDFLDWRNAFIAFGRILRKDGKVNGIREFRDANEEERKITEVNAGCYIFNAKWLWENLEKVKNQNAQNEYYLTDLLHIAAKNNEKIETITIEPHEALGANTKEELQILENFEK